MSERPISRTTSESLLLRVRDTGDRDAWNRFYAFYAPLILAFSRQKGCSPELAADVLQESMVWLIKTMPSFSYDRSIGQFRSFLLKIVHGRIKDAFKRETRYRSLDDAGSESSPDWVTRLEDSEVDLPGESWDRLWEHNLFLHALERVKARISDLTFLSFEMYVLNELPVHVVQERLGIEDRNTVYQHKNRVLRLLEHELEVLKKELSL